MGPFSIHDAAVKDTVTEWLSQAGELLAEYYVPHSGSGGNYYMLTSMAQFKALADKMWAGEVLFILRAPQFPLGGDVDDVFIRRTLAEIPEGEFYLVVESYNDSGLLAIIGSGDTQAELRAELESQRGKTVRVGLEPRLPDKYWVKNSDPGCLVLRG